MAAAEHKHRAFLKWAGGKYGLIEPIRAHLPDGNRLIEPFVGAGSVFLNTDYERYMLNDINPDLIALYRALQTDAGQMIDRIGALFTQENNTPERYYQMRDEFNAETDSLTRSALFVYLNRHGYNGLCRYNRSGGFNVPFGRYKRPYFPEAELLYFAHKAKRAVFSCAPFQSCFKRARAGNVIYCDPPYAPISDTAYFTQYAGNGFSIEDQRKLAELAETANANKRVTVLISNHDTPDTRNFYRHAALTKLKVKRTISRKGNNRKPVGELLALFR